jgi:hypothetical protein
MTTLDEEINHRIMADPTIRAMIQRVMPRQPSYRYFQRQGSKDRYFWTTEKINHKNKPRFVAGIYRYLKTKKQFKLVKKVGFAKRYKAKEWALKAKEKATSPEVA